MTTPLTTLNSQQITALENAQRKRLQQPIVNWQYEIKSDQVKLSAWGKISGAINSLSGALDAIEDPGSFTNRGATSSDEGVATVSVDKGAVPGNYH